MNKWLSAARNLFRGGQLERTSRVADMQCGSSSTRRVRGGGPSRQTRRVKQPMDMHARWTDIWATTRARAAEVIPGNFDRRFFRTSSSAGALDDRTVRALSVCP